MEPSIEVWMSLICPSLRATIPTVNSMILPKVTFRNPPSPCPTFLVNSSVVRLNNEARAMRAKKFVVNIIVGDHPSKPEMSAKGRNINNTWMRRLRRMMRTSFKGLKGWESRWFGKGGWEVSRSISSLLRLPDIVMTIADAVAFDAISILSRKTRAWN